MPARPAARVFAAVLGYVCVALAFSWPLPLHVASALTGPPKGDTGVYIWNLWVFRHEIIEHHHLPFLTSEILALTAPVPLSLHNYTTFANLLAFPLLPHLGIVATFNVLLIASGVMTAFAMFLFTQKRIGDDVAAWLAGLVFGFSPFMSARATGHFSLLWAAPLPIFALLLHRISERPTLGRAAAAGGVVAWAFLCDPYYAVYCLMMKAFMVGHSVLTFEQKPRQVRRVWWIALLDLAVLCVGGLILGIILRGGGRVEVLGIPVSMTQLYTPVLLLTILGLVRIALTIGPRVSWGRKPLRDHVWVTAVVGLVCGLALTPVLYSAGSPFDQRTLMGPPVFWRSSAPGVDLLALFVPNPFHAWFGARSEAWLQSLPNGFVENVASVPWVVIAFLGVAVIRMGFRPPMRWVMFTVTFAVLALGPFILVAGRLTYIPTPWALLRYLPIFGAARVPTRMTVLVSFGVAILTAMAIHHIRSRTTRPRTVMALIGAALLFELAPAPRVLYSAEVPEVYRRVATDPRRVRVLTLPFGVRDGLGSRGNFSPATQFYQTLHEKRLIGGYISRLPMGGLEQYRRSHVTRVLMRLSEGREVPKEMMQAALDDGREALVSLDLAYVVIDQAAAAPELIDFATRAFGLTFLEADGSFELYRTTFGNATVEQPR
jgi:hypothetical protein